MNAATDSATQKCLQVFRASKDDPVQREIRDLPLPRLPEQLVRVKVHYSSLNFKDALCATGHPGVARSLPVIPGIDAAGEVIDSNNEQVEVGQQVLVQHASFGTSSDGGYRQFVDVPAEWIYPLANSFDCRQAMIIGTAGFTAAHSVWQLQQHGVEPGSGPIVVTGATGGVGIVAVKLLSQLGYEVVAVSGKQEHFERLKSLGASEVVGRDAVTDDTDRPLLSSRWAGAVDCVGGRILETIIRSTQPGGCVTACGLVAGIELNLTVHPFILRGVTLQGIDSAGQPRERRIQIWNRLATDYRMDNLESLVTEVDLAGLGGKIDDILAGRIVGRVIVRLPE